jgi:hypothetical protein
MLLAEGIPYTYSEFYEDADGNLKEKIILSSDGDPNVIEKREKEARNKEKAREKK